MRYKNELQLQYKKETGNCPASETYTDYDFKADPDLTIEAYPEEYVQWLEDKLLKS